MRRPFLAHALVDATRGIVNIHNLAQMKRTAPFQEKITTSKIQLWCVHTTTHVALHSHHAELSLFAYQWKAEVIFRIRKRNQNFMQRLIKQRKPPSGAGEFDEAFRCLVEAPSREAAVAGHYK